jgi:hypothetical protein
MRADHGESLSLELAQKVSEQRVVALARRGDGARQGAHASEVRFERGEVRPVDLSDHADLVAARALQQFEAPTQLGDPDVRAIEGLERGIGEASQPDHEGGFARSLPQGRQLDRQRAAAGDQA